jgi:hypothetical protein
MSRPLPPAELVGWLEDWAAARRDERAESS